MCKVGFCKINGKVQTVGACIARPPKSDETSRTDKDVRPYALRMTNFCKPVGALHEAPEKRTALAAVLTGCGFTHSNCANRFLVRL